MYINRSISGENFYQNGPHLQETKDKISKSNLGKSKGKGIPKSPSHKKSLSIAKLGNKNPNFGKSLSKETIEKRTIKQAKFWKLITPNNEILFIQDLHDFCKSNKLDSSNMVNVSKGIYKQYKGWKCLQITEKEFNNEKK